MQDALNLSTDDGMDWQCVNDAKSTVIYQDKLISDALFGCQPIKTEHSYSLNSDGDSIPDSPRSLQNKIDGMFSTSNIQNEKRKMNSLMQGVKASPKIIFYHFPYSFACLTIQYLL